MRAERIARRLRLSERGAVDEPVRLLGCGQRDRYRVGPAESLRHACGRKRAVDLARAYAAARDREHLHPKSARPRCDGAPDRAHPDDRDRRSVEFAHRVVVPAAFGANALEPACVLAQREQSKKDELREHPAMNAGRARERDAGEHLRRKRSGAHLLAGARGGALHPTQLRRARDRAGQPGRGVARDAIENLALRDLVPKGRVVGRAAREGWIAAVVRRIARRGQKARLEPNLVVAGGGDDSRRPFRFQRRHDPNAHAGRFDDAAVAHSLCRGSRFHARRSVAELICACYGAPLNVAAGSFDKWRMTRPLLGPKV